MKRRSFLFFSMIAVLSITSCVKETYDMSRYKKDAHFSPTLAISAITGNVTFKELDIDLNIRILGLEILDTVDNFLKVEDLGKTNPFKPENLEKLSVEIDAKNGFPLVVSMQMILLDSKNNIKTTVKAKDILDPAPVDSNGKVTGSAETKTSIEFTKDILRSIPTSDKIIFQFTFTTPNSGANYVTIYSDYKIYFTAALVMKPDIKLN
jgi:hypothetical protein